GARHDGSTVSPHAYRGLTASAFSLPWRSADDGFNYVAGDAAAPFLASLTSIYSQRLKERAQWVVERFTGMTTSEIRQITHRLFDSWSSQFQALDGARGR
ncbi:MAG: hypothetical protein LC540_13745, partial [Candidatus Thiodiazotropha sp.]|nr:hypothetical protein [Candidatus Thiodiazotropha sp.]